MKNMVNEDKERIGYFEYLLNDSKHIVPMVMFIGTHSAVLLTAFLTYRGSRYGFTGWTVLFGFMFIISLRRFYKYWKFGGTKAKLNMSVNDLAYSGKWGKWSKKKELKQNIK